MNRLLCVFLVIGLCVGVSNARRAKFGEKNTVFFKNSLGFNKVLKVHCLSHDDDLGYHSLRIGETYDFSFNDSLLKTKFFCDLWQGPDFKHHAGFTAYEGGGLIVHFGKRNYWEAREDGVYFTHGHTWPKLEHKWEL
ncbi:unnamed protein product [Cochlearia groenlandica]